MIDVIELELTEETPVEIDIDFEGEYVSGATGEEYGKGYNAGFTDGEKQGYDNGYADGEQAGQKAEYDKFWDTFQNNGNSQNYYYAFAHDRYSDKNYNPKYPIKCSSGTTDARYIFYTSPITDTKVEIVANNKDLNYCFHNSDIVTIRKITVVAATAYTNTFYNCQDLKNITFGGTIGQDISFANSRYLTDASVESIITALKDLTGATAKKITFHTSVVNNLTAEQLLQIANKNWQVG